MIPQKLIDAYIQGFNSSSPNESYQATVGNGLEAVFDYLTETNQDENGNDARPEALRNAVVTMAAIVPVLGPSMSHTAADLTLELADKYLNWLTH